MAVQHLRLMIASIPSVWVMYFILASRVSLFIQFDEWITPNVWMVDLTIWLLAPLVYLLPAFEKGAWMSNFRLIYWIAFGVLTFVYGTAFTFTAWEMLL